MSPRQDWNPADLWERLVDAGLSEDEATQHVQRLQRITAPEAYAKDRDVGVGGKLASAALGAAQGVTFGLGDEAAAALEGTARAVVPGGKGFREGYREAKEAEQATRTAAPGYALAGDIAGSIVGPGAAVGRLARAATGASKLARAGRAATVLGGTGALEGAARGESPAGRVAGATLGGVTGGALGASPIALAIGREYMLLPFTPAGRALRAVRRGAIRLEGGEPAARLLSHEEVLTRQAERAMEQPTFLRRGQPQAPSRAVVTGEGAEIISPPPLPATVSPMEAAITQPTRVRHRPFVPETPEAGKAQLEARLAAARGQPVSGEAMRATRGVPKNVMPGRLEDFSDDQLHALLRAADVDPTVTLSPTQYAAVKDELARRASIQARTLRPLTTPKQKARTHQKPGTPA